MKIKLEQLKITSFITKKNDIKAGICSLGSGCNFTAPHCSQMPNLCF